MSISLGLSTLSTLQELPDDDFSPDQPRSRKLTKNNSLLKFNEPSSLLLNTTSELSFHDLQTKYVMLSAEANRLLTNNQNLSSENKTLEQRCHEAEKLVGRTITVTIDKNLESSQRGQIYELNDRLDMAKNIIVKQNKEILSLKSNNISSIMKSEDEDVWKQKYSELETKLDQQAHKYHDLLLKLEKKFNETLEAKNELLKQSELQKSDILDLTQQLQITSEEKVSLEVQLDSSRIELETSKEEIEMLKREVLRMRQQLVVPSSDNSHNKQVLIPNLNLQRANNINNFGKRFCLKFLKSIRGDDAVSEIESFFDEQGKFTTGRFQTVSSSSAEQIQIPNNFTTETVQEEEDEESSEKRYSAKDMNLLRKELIEYEQIIMFLSQKVKSSDDKQLLDFIQKNNNIQDENSKLLKEIKTYRDKISELEQAKTNTQITCQSEETELSIKIGEYQSKLIQLEQDKYNMKEDLKDSQLLIQAYIKENEKLQNLIDQYKSTENLKIEEYEKAIQKLNEYQRLEEANSTPQVQQKAVEILKQKFTHFEKNFDIIAKQNEDLKRKINTIQQELQASNQKITELTRENDIKTKEIHNLTSKEAQDEKIKEKWLHSYTEMEEIVATLESRKESMQNQLNKMREIIESNNEEIFQLSEINQRQELENQVLIQEIQRLQHSTKNHHLQLASHKFY